MTNGQWNQERYDGGFSTWSTMLAVLSTADGYGPRPQSMILGKRRFYPSPLRTETLRDVILANAMPTKPDAQQLVPAMTKETTLKKPVELFSC